jgi:hypothetical protein
MPDTTTETAWLRSSYVGVDNSRVLVKSLVIGAEGFVGVLGELIH